MKPGPELDALVAEKVMGLVFVPHQDLFKENGIVGFRPAQWQNKQGVVFVHDKLPHYSTDISAAWEVTLLMFQKGWDLNLENYDKGKWPFPHWRALFAKLKNQEICALELADTAPHAICLAALKAIENK